MIVPREKNRHEKYVKTNIYGEKLVPCREKNMKNGSWMPDGTCSEQKGGVHQICIKNISENTDSFSQKTGQTNWSDKRGSDNHCVCLGAWSLYSYKNFNNIKNNTLKCESIPQIALSKKYVSKFKQGWNKWNDLEIDDQIVYGVNSLMNQCYDYTSNEKKFKNLKKKYCKLTKNIKSFSNTSTYKKLC